LPNLGWLKTAQAPGARQTATTRRPQHNEVYNGFPITDYFEAAAGPRWAEDLLERIDPWRGNAAMNDDLTLVEIWRELSG